LVNTLNAVRNLFELLNKEAENLVIKSDPSALTHVVARKKEVVLLLEQYSNQLGQILSTEKLNADHDGINKYLNIAQNAGINIGDSKDCWSTITVLTKKCRALNEQNGASIELLSRHTQRAIQILKGKSQMANTYGRDGSTQSEMFSHTVISV